jgi:ribonuclease HII
LAILGIDEVGRGPWAGPLVVGACVLGDAKIDGLTDSKKLSAKKREQLAAEIHQKVACGLGWIPASELDEIGLSAALRKACRMAVKQLSESGASFHEIIIDGTVNFLSDTKLSPYVQILKKADLLVPEVSAASIIAKVARDNYMIELAKKYPEYAFEKHVGYGTAAHKNALLQHGVCPEHRKSFRPIREIMQYQTDKPAHDNTTRRGRAGENAVAEYLREQGYEIIVQNWKNKYCEIDLVAQKNKQLLFVEVKYRKNSDGLEAITSQKLQQMRFAAEYYLASNELADIDCQLAAASVDGAEFSVKDFLILE